MRERCDEHVDPAAVYAGLAALGIDYGPAFRGLEEGRRTNMAALGRLARTPAAGHLLHPAVLDAAFHTAALPGGAPEGRAFVPAAVGRLTFTGLRTAPVWATCRLRSVDGDTATVDLRLWDEDEQLVLEAGEFELSALSPLDGALFETHWQPRPAAQQPPAEGSWLILADDTGVAAALAERLGSTVPRVIARRGESFGVEDPVVTCSTPPIRGTWPASWTRPSPTGRPSGWSSCPRSTPRRSRMPVRPRRRRGCAA